MLSCKTLDFTIRIKGRGEKERNYQASIERTEKLVQAFGRMMTRFVCITQPLEGADAHSTIKGTSSKR
jgi:hypothetical protein